MSFSNYFDLIQNADTAFWGRVYENIRTLAGPGGGILNEATIRVQYNNKFNVVALRYENDYDIVLNAFLRRSGPDRPSGMENVTLYLDFIRGPFINDDYDYTLLNPTDTARVIVKAIEAEEARRNIKPDHRTAGICREVARRAALRISR